MKTRSIREASFHSMFRISLLVLLAGFLVISVFVITVAFLLVSSHQNNLSNILMNNYHEKQERILSISSTLSDILKEDNSQVQKELFLQNSIGNISDINGILILDEKGVVTDATDGYKDFIELDLSGKEYYREIINNKNKKYVIPSSYVSYKTKKITLNIATPVVKDNKLIGIVVVLVNPSIVENRNLRGLEYYLADSNGDIIFQSYDRNIVTKEDNIKDSVIMEKGLNSNKALFYKDKITNRFVIGSISEDPITSMFVVVQYDVFGNKAIFNGLAVLFALTVIFVIIFIVLISSRVSDAITKYINIFKNYAKRISSGEYDAKIHNNFRIEEISDIVGSLDTMADKIKKREEELQAYNEELIAANDEIKGMLESLSNSEKEKKEQYLQIIWTMVNLLEIKDEYTAGHSKAVTYYAEEISERLNKDYGFNIDVERIQVAAILHDIGKIGIDKDILNKPSRLTREEYDVIKTHPAKGYYALKNIESLKEERKIIKYHHERIDGSGYPEGIRGEEIPLGARIIGVADAFDAMVSDRPYRKGMPLQMAIGELERNKGTQFDPFIVEVFVDMLRNGQFEAAQTEAQ